MSPRVFLSGLFHETNTFVEQATELSAFQIRRDVELFDCLGNESPMDGFLQSARDYGWAVVPGVDYRASPSGPLADSVFESYWEDFCPRIETALVEGLDAIFLILHGAMATESLPDVEGELFRRIRHLRGAESLPLFAVLDLHANVSEQMAEHATALIPYRKNPHTDARETAVRAARHLWRMWAERKTLHTAFRHSRLLLAPPSTGSSDEPLRTLNEMARALEQSANHWEIGIAPGFAHADTPDTGLTFWVVSDQPEMTGDPSLETLIRAARSLVHQLKPQEWDLNEAIRHIEHTREFPALLVEPADNIGGGAPGDATFILRALQASSLEKAGVILNDPEVVRQLQTASIGQAVRISLGGKKSTFDPGPVDMEAILAHLSDGQFNLEDKQSHLASMVGSQVNMGPCAVVTHRNVTILITTHATPPFDLGQWRSQGIDPASFQVIGIKAAVGHRRAYDPLMRSSYSIRTPGPCTSDLSTLPYRKLRRPIYPLDPI